MLLLAAGLGMVRGKKPTKHLLKSVGVSPSLKCGECKRENLNKMRSHILFSTCPAIRWHTCINPTGKEEVGVFFFPTGCRPSLPFWALNRVVWHRSRSQPRPRARRPRSFNTRGHSSISNAKRSVTITLGGNGSFLPRHISFFFPLPLASERLLLSPCIGAQTQAGIAARNSFGTRHRTVGHGSSRARTAIKSSALARA